MLTKTIKYTDFNGNEREEKLYFNISRAEAIKMEYTDNGRLSTKLINVTDADGGTIIRLVEELIFTGYGEKSEDGRYLVKNDEIRNRFAQSAAYDALFTELATDAEKLTAFIQGMLPDLSGDDGKKPLPLTK